MNNVKNKLEQLKKQIRHHNYQYYVLDQPKISDSAYDKLFKELLELEKQHPDLVAADSPSQRVGAEPLKSFKTVTH